MKRERSLTGDRPSGPLHLGHYLGSLKSRLKVEESYEQFVMIADAQALTDDCSRSKMFKKNVLEVMLDYLSVGLNPEKTTFLVQSQIPALFILSSYFLNLVSWNRMLRNPTIKDELKQKNFGDSIPAGFMTYPIFQVADILAFKPSVVPVGADQVPMIEQTNEVVRKFNNIYGETFKELKPLLSEAPRLIGIYGKTKMGKSLNNSINLKDDLDIVRAKVRKMYTDPNHIRVEDKGNVEGNVVFHYLDHFAKDKEMVKELKEHYEKGGLADSKVKEILVENLWNFLQPIQERRAEWANRPNDVWDILQSGTKKANVVANETLEQALESMGMDYQIKVSLQ